MEMANVRERDTTVSDVKCREIAKTGYFAAKRVLDTIAAVGIGSVLLVPMAIIAVFIKMDSSGTVLFKQERLGKNGKPFVMYKFRSMRMEAEADGPQWAKENDDRCTRVGRFLRDSRLDELPQLWNIVRGDMSFVGPRPERAFFYDKFEEYISGFRKRLMVTPGLTGYAQVKGGYNLLPEEKLAYDLEYIENQSLKLDWYCIIKTVSVVITHEGAR